MKSTFEETLIKVWRQALAENTTVDELDGNRYPVRRTRKRGLRRGFLSAASPLRADGLGRFNSA
jgi:hypothetical protein